MVWLRTHLSRMSVTQGCDNVSQLPRQPYALSDTSTNDQKTTGKQTSHYPLYFTITCLSQHHFVADELLKDKMTHLRSKPLLSLDYKPRLTDTTT